MSGEGRLLTGPAGERYRFDPGGFWLELLVTGGPGAHRRHEILHTPDDLAAWLVDSRLAAIAPLAAGDLRIKPMELHDIKRFRDSMWTVARDLAHGRRPVPGALALINDGAAASPRPRIDPATGARAWHTPLSGVQVLGAAAREAIDLITGPAATRVRECAAPDCHLVFLDTSRPGNRRWCSMERCGNRRKVHAYRSRRQAG
ncbi:CGNR zinc finger domain-containing protein [Marinactinospora rubrisoli]|uniref:CGNR zinc finger domain-containing protein n=1 Tax=Marinactinospora rubrisoli TaxID=2715399 RepID=A0ABW2KNH0_9ACTN